MRRYTKSKLLALLRCMTPWLWAHRCPFCGIGVSKPWYTPWSFKAKGGFFVAPHPDCLPSQQIHYKWRNE